jgi:hypothetical protein
MKRGLAALMLAAACSQSSGTVVGTVVSVEGSLTDVSSFTLLVAGDQMTFIPSGDGEYDFPLTHLRQHLIDGTPIRVGWEQSPEGLVALTVADA